LAGVSERVSVTIADGVADVRMTRADKRNALDARMSAALFEAGEMLRVEPGVRAVVLSGEGASFCAGADLDVFRADAGADAGGPPDKPAPAAAAAPDRERITHGGQRTYWVWQEIPVPVIAAVHGHALGGGFQLALAADIRFVHPDTKMSLRDVYWGLVPDMTGTVSLGRLVRADVLKDLLLTARIFTGGEGAELGVATSLSEDPYADAHAYARAVADQNPDAVRAAKRLINGQLHRGAAEQLLAEHTLNQLLSGTANQAETIRANFEKRRAVYPA
jgi:enoyl-CoA hydratase/carnithine racemase